MKYCTDCKHCVASSGELFVERHEGIGYIALCDRVRDLVYKRRAICEDQRRGVTTDVDCGRSGYFFEARE